MPQIGARGQNLGHLRIFFLMESLVFEQQILYRVDSLCDFFSLLFSLLFFLNGIIQFKEQVHTIKD